MNPVCCSLSRRRLILNTLPGIAVATAAGAQASLSLGNQAQAKQTDFQIACMTLPYSAFPLQRALSGIRAAGFQFVAWGTTHQTTPGGERVPVVAHDAPVQKAVELAKQCRDLGLEPLMMFSTVYPEDPQALKVLTHRIEQAGAARIPQLLTFGHTEGDNRAVWIERLRTLGPIARDAGVLLVIKQHGGTTGTGKACAEIVREVDDRNIQVNYDAGNVMDYLNLDPIPDIQSCADVVHSFCMKDHRNWPADQDCAPGLGEIDHYRLLHPVAFTGRSMPLCCENIFAPLVARPSQPEQIDALAKRVREYLETIVTGLQTKTS